MPSDEDGPRRRNGLEWPFHYLQVATWLLFPLVLIHYFAYLMPLLWSHIADRVIVTFIFCTCCITAVIGGYLTCSIDPADDMIIKNDDQVPPPSGLCSYFQKVSALPSDPKEDEQIYCYVCEINVHDSSKHCRYCRKCILRFDHHCKWLNTCVGAKNYRYFLMVVGSVTVMTTISLILSIAYLVEAYANPDMFRVRVHNAHFTLDLAGSGGVAIASVAVLTPLVAMVYQLALFHATLVYNGITTYEFIVQEQKRLRDKDAAKHAARVEKERKKKEAAAAARAATNSQSSGSQSAAPVPLEYERGNIEMVTNSDRPGASPVALRTDYIDVEKAGGVSPVDIDQDCFPEIGHGRLADVDDADADDPASEYFERLASDNGQTVAVVNQESAPV